jgi:ribose-phosphate pyrophosphokinase
VLTIDLHSDQIQGFFDIPLDHLTAISLFTDHIKKQNYPNPVIVSPDLGSVKRVRKIADLLDLPFAILDKVRKKPNVVTKVNLLGDVRGKTAILIDDMIDTGHTICAAIKKIKQEGSEMVVADTIPITRNYKKLQVLSVASLLSNAVENIHQNKSVSALFN